MNQIRNYYVENGSTKYLLLYSFCNHFNIRTLNILFVHRINFYFNLDHLLNFNRVGFPSTCLLVRFYLMKRKEMDYTNSINEFNNVISAFMSHFQVLKSFYFNFFWDTCLVIQVSKKTNILKFLATIKLDIQRPHIRTVILL